jgi:hypothetical protein
MSVPFSVCSAGENRIAGIFGPRKLPEGLAGPEREYDYHIDPFQQVLHDVSLSVNVRDKQQKSIHRFYTSHSFYEMDE